MLGKLMLFAIARYQKYISPYLGNHCRFTPTCSQYAAEAIRVHGACKGFFLALFRLLRCNPLFKGGYDPVPEKQHKLSHR